MFASLRGTIVEKSLQRVVVDVGGVGYRVNVSMQTLAELPPVGEVVQVLCHTHVREDALQLFGFVQSQEQQAFELLISVSGIGPKLAMTILSGMPSVQLVSAIIRGDVHRLQSIPGVGKKTAERMVVELKDRCAKLNMQATPDQSTARDQNGIVAEVVEALANLGYKRARAEKAVQRVIEKNEQVEDKGPGAEVLLRAALAAIAEVK